MGRPGRGMGKHVTLISNSLETKLVPRRLAPIHTCFSRTRNANLEADEQSRKHSETKSVCRVTCLFGRHKIQAARRSRSRARRWPAVDAASPWQSRRECDGWYDGVLGGNPKKGTRGHSLWPGSLAPQSTGQRNIPSRGAVIDQRRTSRLRLKGRAHTHALLGRRTGNRGSVGMRVSHNHGVSTHGVPHTLPVPPAVEKISHCTNGPTHEYNEDRAVQESTGVG